MPYILRKETFDGLTPPALPSDFTADTGLSSSNTVSFSSPNSLKFFNAGSGGNFRYNVADGNNGNTELDAKIYFPAVANEVGWYFILRSDAAVQNGYVVLVEPTGSAGDGIYLYSFVGGTLTQLGTAVPAGSIALATWYQCYFVCDGTNINFYVQRFSDNNWLKSNGTWTPSKVSCQSAVNSAVSGSGYGVIQGFNGASETNPVYADDFIFFTLGLPADMLSFIMRFRMYPVVRFIPRPRPILPMPTAPGKAIFLPGRRLFRQAYWIMPRRTSVINTQTTTAIPFAKQRLVRQGYPFRRASLLPLPTAPAPAIFLPSRIRQTTKPFPLRRAALLPLPVAPGAKLPIETRQRQSRAFLPQKRAPLVINAPASIFYVPLPRPMRLYRGHWLTSPRRTSVLNTNTTLPLPLPARTRIVRTVYAMRRPLVAIPAAAYVPLSRAARLYRVPVPTKANRALVVSQTVTVTSPIALAGRTRQSRIYYPRPRPVPLAVLGVAGPIVLTHKLSVR